jgi:hypothetical protein
MAKDNSTGKDKEFYELGKKMFDRIQPLTTKGNNMNEQCKFINSKGYHCGSYAFNLYKEQIDQGDRCDHHYWQERAMEAAAQEREACAKIAELAEPYQTADLIRARGE